MELFVVMIHRRLRNHAPAFASIRSVYPCPFVSVRRGLIEGRHLRGLNAFDVHEFRCWLFENFRRWLFCHASLLRRGLFLAAHDGFRLVEQILDAAFVRFLVGCLFELRIASMLQVFVFPLRREIPDQLTTRAFGGAIVRAFAGAPTDAVARAVVRAVARAVARAVERAAV